MIVVICLLHIWPKVFLITNMDFKGRYENRYEISHTAYIDQAILLPLPASIFGCFVFSQAELEERL